MRRIPRLHIVTPPELDAEALGRTRAALGAGAPLVQLRSKDIADRQRIRHAEQMRGLTREAGAMLVVNDRVDVALATGADGVHVGADDLPVQLARRLMGPEAIVGATCRTPEAARAAEEAGASYLGVGPAYATRSKAGLPEPLGVAGVAAVAAAVSVPVIAIAGITLARVAEMLEAGAWGVAVLGAVYDAADPAGAVHELLEALSSGGATSSTAEAIHHGSQRL